MKYFVLLVSGLFLFSSAFGYSLSDLGNAQSLGKQGIINSSNNADGFRLDDYVLRQEVAGIALRLGGINLPTTYTCQWYYADAFFNTGHTDSWVCRAVEIAADNGILSRREDQPVESRYVRPADLISRSEALAMLMMAKWIEIGSYVNETSVADWQNNVVQTMVAQWIMSTPGEEITTWFGVNVAATRAEVFQYAVGIQRSLQAPSTCIQKGEYAGWGFVPYPEDPNDFICCDGLTKVDHPEGNMIADIGNTCAKIGDGICESKYESTHNSSDCKKNPPFDFSTCSSYYDGCNTCSYDAPSGSTVCTEMACFMHNSPYCTACQDGYKLRDGQCIKPPVTIDFTGCLQYYDGCNGCSQDENGTMCTARYCEQAELEDPYCSTCKEGYTLTNDRHCIPDLSMDPKYDLSVCGSYYDGCNTCLMENGQTISCTKKYCLLQERPYCMEFAYNPSDQEEDMTQLKTIENNIHQYTKDLTCKHDDDCESIAMGAKACGWPKYFQLFSTYASHGVWVQKAALTEQASQYSYFQKEYNTTYGLVSDCMVTTPPNEVVCENNTCVAR